MIFHIHDQREAVMYYGKIQYAEGKAAGITEVKTKTMLECIRNLMETWI